MIHFSKGTYLIFNLQQGNRSFTVLRKTLKLISDDNNSSSSDPKDIHFVHELYAPLSVRLIQQYVKPNGIRSLSDVISLIPGDTNDFTVDQTSSPFPQRSNTFSSPINDYTQVWHLILTRYLSFHRRKRTFSYGFCESCVGIFHRWLYLR